MRHNPFLARANSSQRIPQHNQENKKNLIESNQFQYKSPQIADIYKKSLVIQDQFNKTEQSFRSSASLHKSMLYEQQALSPSFCSFSQVSNTDEILKKLEILQLQIINKKQIDSILMQKLSDLLCDIIE